MKAFILAAGEGTRMRPLTANTPKPLLPVAGKPFLRHTLEALRENGIKEVTVLIGWHGRRIKDFFGSGENLGLKLTYEEQPERLGTAHAVSLAREHVEGTFLCMNGDIVLPSHSLAGFLAFYKKKRGTTLALARVANPASFGVVQVEDERVKEIEEKPASPKGNWINAGIYVFDDGIFDLIQETPKSRRGEYEITDTIKLLMEQQDVYAYKLEDEWIDVGYPWDLLKANEILLKDLKPSIEGDVEGRATIKGNVQIGKDTIVRDGSYIQGPTIIGDGCEIGPSCLIRPSTYIGNGCKVGSACEVKNSIIMKDTHIPHHNYVGDSIIGESCNFGAGTKIANLRLDGKNVTVTIRGKEIDTGLRKLGVIMGDGVKIGINASLDVGTIVGENTFIGPGALARGNIAPNSRIY